MKYYVKQGFTYVGEAVLMGDVYMVHLYSSYLSYEWKVNNIPKKYKLEPMEDSLQ